MNERTERDLKPERPDYDKWRKDAEEESGQDFDVKDKTGRGNKQYD